MIISCETCADLSPELIEQNNISVLDMLYYVNETEHNQNNQLSSKEFYNKMREGAKTSTTQINQIVAQEYFEQLLLQKEDIIHLSLSSGLSGTYNNLKAAADQLNATNTNKIYVVDSLGACGGIGLLTLIAKQLSNTKTTNQVFEEIEQIKNNLAHIFTVSDLKYLYKGGRVSRGSFVIGNMLNIKPVLKVNQEGKLVPTTKVMGRKKSINTLCSLFEEQTQNTDYPIIICHADCEQDAQALAQKIEEKSGKKPQILDLGFVIGAHSGPETLALFFVGKENCKCDNIK